MSRDFDANEANYLSRTSAVRTAAPLTMACWAYMDDLSENVALMACGGSADDDNHFALLVLGAVGNQVASGAKDAADNDVVALTSAGMSTGRWHHCGAVASTTAFRAAYLDGGNVGVDTTTVVPSGLDRTSIGALVRNTVVASPNARIADAAIWDTFLNAREMLALAVGVSPLRIRHQNLLAYWPLHGLYSPEPDMVGGKLNLTITGTVPQANHAPVIPYSARYWGSAPYIAPVEAAILGGEQSPQPYPHRKEIIPY